MQKNELHNLHNEIINEGNTQNMNGLHNESIRLNDVSSLGG